MNSEESNQVCDAVAADDMVAQYLTEAGSYPRLKPAAEQALAGIIQTANQAKARLEQEGLADEEKAELHALCEKGKKAHRRLVTANLLLVASIAKRFINRGVDFLDLVQEGNKGLMEAAWNFEQRNTRFSTHATPWIKRDIFRAIYEHGQALTMPSLAGQRLRALTATMHRLGRKYGRMPTTDELARAMEISPKAARNLLALGGGEFSLDQPPLEGDEDSSLGEFIPSPGPSTLDVLEAIDQIRRVVELIDYGVKDGKPIFNLKEQAVLKLRCNIPGRPYTPDEIRLIYAEETGQRAPYLKGEIDSLLGHAEEIIKNGNPERELERLASERDRSKEEIILRLLLGAYEEADFTNSELGKMVGGVTGKRILEIEQQARKKLLRLLEA